jgi:hypothetical protein
MVRIQPLLLRAWRASHSVATRLWYGSPVALMAAYLILAVPAELVSGSVDTQFTSWILPILMLAFCCWRVVRRGWISRGILIYLSAGDVVKAAGLAQQWQIQTVAALAISLAALMLLLSPAVYARTHPGSGAASSSIRLRPTRWMILAAPLAGVAAAAVALPVTHRWPLAGRGCMIGPVQGLPGRCVGVGQGFPVPVVATIHGHHSVNQLAFVQDCVQWTLAIFIVSYLLWLALRRRQPTAADRLPDSDLVPRTSQ